MDDRGIVKVRIHGAEERAAHLLRELERLLHYLGSMSFWLYVVVSRPQDDPAGRAGEPMFGTEVKVESIQGSGRLV